MTTSLIRRTLRKFGAAPYLLTIASELERDAKEMEDVYSGVKISDDHAVAIQLVVLAIQPGGEGGNPYFRNTDIQCRLKRGPGGLGPEDQFLTQKISQPRPNCHGRQVKGRRDVKRLASGESCLREPLSALSSTEATENGFCHYFRSEI